MAESRKGQKTGNEDEKPFYKERIAKTDIALMLALWMEKHPCSSDQDKANKVALARTHAFSCAFAWY